MLNCMPLHFISQKKKKISLWIKVVGSIFKNLLQMCFFFIFLKLRIYVPIINILGIKKFISKIKKTKQKDIFWHNIITTYRKLFRLSLARKKKEYIKNKITLKTRITIFIIFTLSSSSRRKRNAINVLSLVI